MTWRPTVNEVRQYTWRDGANNKTGLALIGEHGNIMAHLTPHEALQLAHQIADTLQTEGATNVSK